jgi:hypothetical protein
LVERIGRSGRWQPAILALSLDGYRTPAAAVASEVIPFLSANPSPEALLNYNVSDDAPKRPQRLLTLNAAGMTCEEEQAELNELERVEHLVVRPEAQVAAESRARGSSNRW